MPRKGRRGRIVIEREINDKWVDELKEVDTDSLLKEKQKEVNSLHKTVSGIVKETQKTYKEEGKSSYEETTLKKKGLLSLQEAYEYLVNNGLKVSFRAFGGRVERGTITSVKLERKRYISIEVLNHMLNLHGEFYTVREAFEKYKQYEKRLNLRAFIGRVEKGSVPSIKLGTKRLIPRNVVDSMTEIRKNYYTVPEALGKLVKSNIKIKRSAFERRLDRKRVPFVKIGGKRYIPGDVIDELIEKELEIRAGKKWDVKWHKS